MRLPAGIVKNGLRVGIGSCLAISAFRVRIGSQPHSCFSRAIWNICRISVLAYRIKAGSVPAFQTTWAYAANSAFLAYSERYRAHIFSIRILALNIFSIVSAFNGNIISGMRQSSGWKKPCHATESYGRIVAVSAICGIIGCCLQSYGCSCRGKSAISIEWRGNNRNIGTRRGDTDTIAGVRLAQPTISALELFVANSDVERNLAKRGDILRRIVFLAKRVVTVSSCD